MSQVSKLESVETRTNPEYFDFIVCGAGSSGSVVASRLAETRKVSVLLLEAGGSDAVPQVMQPNRWRENLGSEREWGFTSTANSALKLGGELHIADFGLQRTSLTRSLFKIVQYVDGYEHTQPNADGILPSLMKEAGFAQVNETAVILTLTGSISLYRGIRSPSGSSIAVKPDKMQHHSC